MPRSGVRPETGTESEFSDRFQVNRGVLHQARPVARAEQVRA
jgi:hypothetical protein